MFFKKKTQIHQFGIHLMIYQQRVSELSCSTWLFLWIWAFWFKGHLCEMTKSVVIYSKIFLEAPRPSFLLAFPEYVQILGCFVVKI